MKPLLLPVFFLIIYATQAQTPTQWFHCSFDRSEVTNALISIKLISSSQLNGQVSDIVSLPDQRLGYTGHDPNTGHSKISFMDIEVGIKGDLFRSSKSCSQLDIQPETNNLSFIFHSDHHQIVFIFDQGNYKAVFKTNNIVDYTWINRDHLAVVEIDKDDQIIASVYNILTGKTFELSNNSGRTVIIMPDNEVAFIDIFSDSYRYIKLYSLNDNRSRILKKIPNTIEMFAVYESNTLLICEGHEILQYTPDHDSYWRRFYSFNSYGLDNITNVVSPGTGQIIIRNEN